MSTCEQVRKTKTRTKPRGQRGSLRAGARRTVKGMLTHPMGIIDISNGSTLRKKQTAGSKRSRRSSSSIVSGVSVSPHLRRWRERAAHNPMAGTGFENSRLAMKTVHAGRGASSRAHGRAVARALTTRMVMVTIRVARRLGGHGARVAPLKTRGIRRATRAGRVASVLVTMPRAAMNTGPFRRIGAGRGAVPPRARASYATRRAATSASTTTAGIANEAIDNRRTADNGETLCP